jgi:hypothetical protein
MGFIDYAGGEDGGLQVHSSLLKLFSTIKQRSDFRSSHVLRCALLPRFVSLMDEIMVIPA